jgi:unconventional prefoldin RPB5 interactor 1
MDDSALAHVERQRVELEANIDSLRRSLRHWQTLEIDYEGLREEFLGIPDDSSAEKCLAAAKDSKPELVNEKQLKELLVDGKSQPRRPAQLVDLLSKRVEYVTRNIETIRKQLSGAEKKRNALLLAEEPDYRDEAGLPLAEIVEELDESGRVISSKVQTPSSDAPQLLNVLKKAGVEDLAQTGGRITVSPSAAHGADDGQANSSDGEDDIQPAVVTQNSKQEMNSTAGPFPTNVLDTPEEAELRREMLEYSRGLDEFGAIVAELELEENASDVSIDEDDAELDFDSEMDVDEDLDEESEDETGKSKHSLSLSRGYEKRMAELQEKLGLENVGPRPGVETIIQDVEQEHRPPAAEAARKAAIARDEKSKTSLKSATKKPTKDGKPDRKKTGTKKVAFSSELDIAPETKPSPAPAPAVKQAERPVVRPIHDSIVERVVDQDDAEPSVPNCTPSKVVKTSRFTATRQSQPQTSMFSPQMDFPSKDADEDIFTPTPPPNTISRDLVERPAPKTAKAPDPTDFTDEAHNREIATEYHQHRIKRILAQEGRFLGSEEGEITPLEDEETGRRVSRFKAARVNR